MNESKYVYVTYIRTTPQKLWDALTKPEFQKQYWFGMHQETDWEGRLALGAEVHRRAAPRMPARSSRSIRPGASSSNGATNGSPS